MTIATMPSRQAVARESDAGRSPLHEYDPLLIGTVAITLALGLVMVASASVGISERAFGNPLHFFWRQVLAAGLGLGVAVLVLRTPLDYWSRSGGMFLLLALVLLTLVLVPGLGREVNGSMRWVRLGPVSMQTSEPAKLCVVLYFASYLVRHAHHVRSTFLGFIKPVGVMTMIAALLLLQPDYGATVVLFATTLGMLFMGGVPVARFCSWAVVAVTSLAAIAMLAPYRLQRLMTFRDPWSDPYDTGFQLTQALIAFGRGESFGVGLGASVQKLFYLPEVHTDFILAVIGEELGLAGTLTVIALFGFIVWRAFEIGAIAEQHGQQFNACLAYGIGFLIGFQAFINVGVNLGMLPTKGLTLPLVSYGSNSLVMTCAALALLLRVAYEIHRPSRALDEDRRSVP